MPLTIEHKNPMADGLRFRWRCFEEQARKLCPYLQRFGLSLESVSYDRVANSNSYRFTAIYRNHKRLVNLSLITAMDKEGAVSFFISNEAENGPTRTINLYKYLRKHFGMLNRKSLFLSHYSSGDFSNRLQRVFRSYARFSQFYMQSILSGAWWNDK